MPSDWQEVERLKGRHGHPWIIFKKKCVFGTCMHWSRLEQHSVSNVALMRDNFFERSANRICFITRRPDDMQ